MLRMEDILPVLMLLPLLLLLCGSTCDACICLRHTSTVCGRIIYISAAHSTQTHTQTAHTHIPALWDASRYARLYACARVCLCVVHASIYREPLFRLCLSHTKRNDDRKHRKRVCCSRIRRRHRLMALASTKNKEETGEKNNRSDRGRRLCCCCFRLYRLP